MFLEKVAASKSNTFILWLAAFIAGVFLFSVIGARRAHLGMILFIIAVQSVIAIIFWKEKARRLLSIAALFLFFGGLRLAMNEPSASPAHLNFYHGRYVEMEGQVAEESSAVSTGQRMILSVETIRLLSRESRLARGRAILFLERYPEYQYGDKLRVACSLAAPLAESRGWLLSQRVWSVCSNPQVRGREIGQGNLFYHYILAIKNFLVRQVNELLPEPQASFLGGLLYGARQSIPSDLRLAFNRTGTAHIIAISGYNITIIAGALLAILRGCWVPRCRAFWLVTAGVIIFVFLTGAQAAVVRAGVMGIVVLLAKHLGRLSQAGRVLILTAFLMLIFNPGLIFFDLGFQLSFASTLGLVYVSPLLEKLAARLPNTLGFKESLTTTLSAILATTPLLLHSFGRFSMVAPLANLLILPAIPLTMALGFSAVVAGAIFFPLGQFMAWLAWLPLTYIIKVAEFLSSWRHAAFDVPALPGWAMAIVYGMIIFFILRARSKVSKILRPPARLASQGEAGGSGSE